MACEVNDYIIVAAIDFGTTYSGFAFSTRHDFVRDPTKVTTKTWIDPTGNMTSEKTATSILFKPDKTFHSFGFEADEKYMSLADDDEHEYWFYFTRFKMMLYNQMVINDFVELESADGGTMLAMDVFSESIRYLKDKVLDLCKKQTTDIFDSDIKWVLTLPAIWTDTAKGFMRKAAEKAGIPSKKLIMCLEPEAAAVCIKHIPLERKVKGHVGDSFQIFTPGSKYLVCDAGGGTIDITAHEVKYDGSMKEIFLANGGNWGGTKVDEALQFVFKEIFGDHAMSKFTKENRYDTLEIQRIFEVKKRLIDPTKDSSMFIKVPASLHEAFKKNNKENNTAINKGSVEQIQSQFSESEMTLEQALSDVDQYVIFKKDKLQLKTTLCQLLFKESVDAICDHLRQIFEKEEMVHADTMLLVGGYSDSPVLQHRIQTTFPHRRLIIPNEASLSVLKGAVIYGHNPDLIKERVCKYTYGVACSTPFKDGVHREDYKFVDEKGRIMCKNIFDIHVRKGESVIVGQVQSRMTYWFCQKNKDNKYIFLVYISTDSDPTYTTDDSCTKIGCVIIEIPKDKIDIYKDGMSVSFTFSGTEIEVEAAFGKTREKVKSYLQFEQ